MMRASLRLLAKIEQTPERLISQYTFVNKQNILTKLYPLKDPSNCKCGKPAVFVNVDPICSDCLNNLISFSELKVEQGLIFPSLEKSVRSGAFEWTPSGESWYKIHGRNLCYDATIPMTETEKKQRFLAIMEKVLLGEPQTVDCRYIIGEKKLIIYV
jgi:hypothetical protein